MKSKKILLKFFELFLKKGGDQEIKYSRHKFDNEKPILISDKQRYTFDKIVIAQFFKKIN